MNANTKGMNFITAYTSVWLGSKKHMGRLETVIRKNENLQKR